MTAPDEEEFEAGNDIAIVGVAGVVPGSRDIAQLWDNLRSGRDGITRFTREHLLAQGIPAAIVDSPGYVPAAPVLEGIEEFDPSFFGFPAGEAKVIDPQQRLLLETAWHALEDAGVDPSRFDGPIGVYAGCGLSTYLLNNLVANPEIVQEFGPEMVAFVNDKDSLATRVSYALDLTGPSYGVQSYSSSSLVAVCAACTSLVTGETDLALAGGVSIDVPHQVGYFYEEGGRYTPDAVVRSFDADANGTIIGNGVGVVALKRLEDAIEDNDRVYAVIRGWAVNNDGAAKAGFTAPGVRGQAGVVAEALASAGLDPHDIDYVETNCTGTPYGDAAEITALQQVFKGTEVKIGSIKPNIGHLNQAAGVISLIKTVLAMHHGELPPTLNYQRPNPQLAKDPCLTVQSELGEWPWSEVKRAGVSSFGFGGTNAHVVLEEPPTSDDEDLLAPREHQLLVWSARSAESADAVTEQLAEADPAQLAYTLQTGRKVFEHKRIAVVTTQDDARRALTEEAASRVLSAKESTAQRPVGFLIAGVGEQYPGMAGSLYAGEPVFRQAIDECAEIFSRHLGTNPVANLVGERTGGGNDLARLLGRSEGAQSDNATETVQPAVFAVEYALGKLLLDWGVQPSILAGYSVGEFVAAALAESLTLQEAAGLVAVRAKLIAPLPKGSMVAVPLSGEELSKHIGALPIDVAAVNGPQMSVASGPLDAVAELTALLAGQAVPCRPLSTTHAFHSRSLRPIAAELTAWARGNISPKTPKIPYLSNVTGAPITDKQLRDSGYWAEHMCRTVQFSEMIRFLSQEHANSALLEIGAGQSLGAMMRSHPDCPADRWSLQVPSLPGEADPRDGGEVLTEALGRLWLTGVDIDWLAYHEGRSVRKTTAPSYRFQRERHWVDAPNPLSTVDEFGLPLLEQKKDNHGGVYLITGGLGEVGLLMAEQLGVEFGATIVLAGRHGVPPQEEWDRLLAGDPDTALTSGVDGVRQLRHKGIEVEVTTADVATEERLERLVTDLRTRYGRLDGVVHLPGA